MYIYIYIYAYIYIYIYIYIYVHRASERNSVVVGIQIPLRPTFYSYFKESLYIYNYKHYIIWGYLTFCP